MSLTVKVINALVGSSHILTEPDVSNWPEIIDDVTTDQCNFTLEYNGDTYTGGIAKTVDGLQLMIAFDNPVIALPGGMCLVVTCLVDNPGMNGCYPNLIQDYNQFIRLMAVDENGCPIGYIFVQELITEIASQLNIPTTLCELIGDEGIPEGIRVASDRVLVTSGDPACTLKSVLQDDFLCP